MNVSGQKISFRAGGAITAFSAVRIAGADNTVIAAVDALSPIVGVAEFSADTGRDVTVQTTGVARVRAGAAVTRNTLLTAGAGGAVVPAAPGAGVNHFTIGIALASGVLNDEIPVLLTPAVQRG